MFDSASYSFAHSIGGRRECAGIRASNFSRTPPSPVTAHGLQQNFDNAVAFTSKRQAKAPGQNDQFSPGAVRGADRKLPVPLLKAPRREGTRTRLFSD